MKISRKTPTTVFAAMLLCSTSATAADHGPRPGRGPISIAEFEARADERFASADLDGDGMVTAAEFEEADIDRPRRHHRRFRGNRGHGPAFGGGDADLDDEIFEAMDTNGNGELSKEEFSAENRHAARMAVMKRQMFATLDENEDAVLTRDEFDRRTRHLKALDVDGDGEVTRDELRAGRRDRSSGAS